MIHILKNCLFSLKVMEAIGMKLPIQNKVCVLIQGMVAEPYMGKSEEIVSFLSEANHKLIHREIVDKLNLDSMPKTNLSDLSYIG